MVYMDDLLVLISTSQTHLDDLQVFVEHQHSEQLDVSPQKGSFVQEDTAFSGMVVERKASG